MRTRRVVFDTNVLISGLIYRGRPHLCLRLADEGVVQSVTSDFILDELSRKLIQRFGFTPERAGDAVARVESFSENVPTRLFVRGISKDPDDDEILGCAASGDADIVVTGDHPLQELNDFEYPGADGATRRVDILSPAQFLALLSKDE